MDKIKLVKYKGIYCGEVISCLLRLIEQDNIINVITNDGRLCIKIGDKVIDAVTKQAINEETYEFKMRNLDYLKIYIIDNNDYIKINGQYYLNSNDVNSHYMLEIINEFNSMYSIDKDEKLELLNIGRYDNTILLEYTDNKKVKIEGLFDDFKYIKIKVYENMYNIYKQVMIQYCED